MTRVSKLILQLAAVVAVAPFATSASAQVDEQAAKALLKKNDCFKCHALDKTKKGPSYKKISAKFKEKGRPAAEKIFNDNLFKEPLVKLEDGTEEKHKVIDTQDPKELKNLFEFISAQ